MSMELNQYLLDALENLPYLLLNKSIQGTLQVAANVHIVLKIKEIIMKKIKISSSNILKSKVKNSNFNKVS
jgi:hypothetical protein